MISPSAARRLAALASVLLLAGLNTAEGLAQELRPVPDPTLEGMEAAVQEQLRTELAAVRGLADRSRSAENGVTDEDLGQSFGDLGRLYLAYDLVAPAEACLANAHQLDPRDPRWPYLLGALLQGDRRLDEAVTAFEATLALVGDDLATWIRLGNVHLARDAPQEAQDAFGRARELAPDQAAAHAGLAKAAVALGDHRAAVEHFEAALERQPQATALRYPLALALRELGEMDAAREQLRERGSVDVSFPDPLAQELLGLATGSGIHLLYGNRALRAGQIEAAIDRYRQAIEANPRSADAHRALGSALLRQGDRQGAVLHYSNALALEPENPDLQYNLGTTLVELGQDDQAIRHFEAALALAEDFHNARFNLATALAKQERFAAAAPHWEQLLEAEGDDPATRFYAAHTFFRLGRPGDAAPLLEGLVSEEGVDRPRARLLLARLRMAEGDLAAAQHHFEAVTRSANAEPEQLRTARSELARLAGRAGRFDEAIALYDALLAETPGDRESRFAQAMALLLSERYAEARDRLAEGMDVLGDDGAFAHLWARFLATCPVAELRDGQTALDLSLALFRPQPRPEVAETIAMAHAELGQFDQAIAWQERLIQEARRAGAQGALPGLEARLEGYRRGEPVRAPWLGGP